MYTRENNEETVFLFLFQSRGLKNVKAPAGQGFKGWAEGKDVF